MKYYILLIILLLNSSFAWSQDLIISNIKIRPALNAGYSTTIYCDIENKSDQLDYLIDVKVQDLPANINKTVIEKNTVRVIKIDRLVVPAHSKITLAPGGMYITTKTFAKELKLEFIFQNHGELITRASSLPSVARRGSS